MKSINNSNSGYTYDVFISYVREDISIVDTLAAALRNEGINLFLDIVAIKAGEDYNKVISEAISRSKVILLIISEAWFKSNWAREELAIAIELYRAGEVRLVPVYLSEDYVNDRRLPYAVRSIQGLILDFFPFTINNKKNLNDFTRQIAELVYRPFTTDLYDIDQSDNVVQQDSTVRLRELATEFFNTAKRTVRQEDEMLWVPEPVQIAKEIPPSPNELRDLAKRLDSGQTGYFAYAGRLSPDTNIALDNLRVRGNSIIPLSFNAMSAALTDKRVDNLLYELDGIYRFEENLYKTRNALIDERYFFGREMLLSRVGSALAKGEHILITGLRKAGKTSFLNILRQRLESNPVCVVDLQRYDRKTENWPLQLFKRIIESYDDWGHNKFNNWPKRTDTAFTATELEKALLKRSDWQRERGSDERLILILDELERVMPASGELAEAKKFEIATGALRVLGQASGKRLLCIIAADLRADANRRNTLTEGAGTNPFFKFFEEVPLALLSEEHTYELIESIGRAMDLRVSRDVSRHIYSLSGGHPAITRLIAAAGYDNRREKERMDVFDVKAGYRVLLDRDELGSFFRNNLWELLTKDEKNEIQKITKNSFLNTVPFLRKALRLLFRPSFGSPALSSLLDQGVLDEDKNIRIGSFAEWLSDTSSIRQKMGF